MSYWVSCQKIVFNLHKAYALNPDLELLNFNYSHGQDLSEISDTALKIFEANADTIIVLDHRPHPLPLLQFLLPMYKDRKKRPRIIFHIYGDFTLFYGPWEKLAHLLAHFEVDFIVASDRQKLLMDKMIAPLKSFVCPFPVDPFDFSYRKELRAAQRKEWKLKDDELALVFAGRLSLQKRIHTVLAVFEKVASELKDRKTHLFFYGNTDHIGDPFLGRYEREGEYFHKINKVYKAIPEHIRKNIHFMGAVKNTSLKSVYQGADYLINISVHNDEDYGMTVAEGLCSGLPAIVTDWGGLSGFQLEDNPKATRFIPVQIGQSSKVISKSNFANHLKECMTTPSILNREKISREALSKLGVETVSEILARILKGKPKTFKAFSPFFQTVCRKQNLGLKAYFTSRKTITPLYKKIYSAYVRKD